MKLLALSSFVILISSLAAMAQTPGPIVPPLPPIPFATPAPRSTPKPTFAADAKLSAAQVTAYLNTVPAAPTSLATAAAALVPSSLGITLAQLKIFTLSVQPDGSWTLHIVYTKP